MPRGLITVVAVAAALFALTFAAAPWFALRSLQAAARDDDVQALSELIDYGAVREGVRSQIIPAEAVPAPKPWEDPLGALAHAMRAPLAPAVKADDLLTPSCLHALVGEPTPVPRLHYWGPARVRFAVGPRRSTLVTFQRRGVLSWRLVQLRLPTSTPARDLCRAG